MNPNLDTGVTGAKRQSFHRSSPRSLLLEIIGKNPKADEDYLLKTFTERVLDGGEEYVAAIIEYWFANTYPRLVKPAAPPVSSAGVVQARVAEAKKKLKDRIDREVQIILLDMLLPNGKRLRDCNRTDCSKAGGWLVKLAAKMKPNQTVGAVFSEDQLRKLFAPKG